MNGHAARLIHKECFDPSCMKRLDLAYAELPSVCVVCGTHTSNRDWGVPLCRTNEKSAQKCIEDWMFGMGQKNYIGLQQALYECGMLIPENEKLKCNTESRFDTTS